MATIYLSSTYKDLIKCRDAVTDTLRNMHHKVIGMEGHGAQDMRPLDKCLEDVKSCDIYVGVFAFRYGFRPIENNSDNKSMTELEYRHAVTNEKPRLLFLLREGASWNTTFIDQGEDYNRIVSLRNEIRLERLIYEFDNAEDLARKVAESTNILEKKLQSGTQITISDKTAKITTVIVSDRLHVHRKEYK